MRLVYDLLPSCHTGPCIQEGEATPSLQAVRPVTPGCGEESSLHGACAAGSPALTDCTPAAAATMVNYRFLSTNTVKVVGLICASLCAWYMGYLFAEVLPEDSLQMAIGSMQKIGMKPVIKAPPPVRQKCAAWRTCSFTEVVYRIRSGGGKNIQPDICLEDEILLGGSKKNADRGINIAVVKRDTMKLTDSKTFDMYAGDFSGPMVEFVNKIPTGCFILVASFDDAVSKLSDAGKKVFEDLGSKEIRNLKFRSQWVFLTGKGVKIPDNIEREKVIHSDGNNRYSGWPAEIQIDGCLPK